MQCFTFEHINTTNWKSPTFSLLSGAWEAQRSSLSLFVILLLFGAKRIPELAKGLGRGIREFKDATNEIKSEIEKPVKDVKGEAGRLPAIKDEAQKETTVGNPSFSQANRAVSGDKVYHEPGSVA